ncbi:hypothetical protein AGLY_001986, partial [Aphis glycines]
WFIAVVFSRLSVLHLSNSASIVSIDDSASDNHPKKLSKDLSKFCKDTSAVLPTELIRCSLLSILVNQVSISIFFVSIDLSKLANKLRRASDELTGDRDRKLERGCTSEAFFNFALIKPKFFLVSFISDNTSIVTDLFGDFRVGSSSDELESGYLSLSPSSSENNTASSVSLSLPSKLSLSSGTASIICNDFISLLFITNFSWLSDFELCRGLSKLDFNESFDAKCVIITKHCSNCPLILSGSSDASSKRQIVFSMDCNSLNTLETRVESGNAFSSMTTTRLDNESTDSCCFLKSALSAECSSSCERKQSTSILADCDKCDIRSSVCVNHKPVHILRSWHTRDPPLLQAMSDCRAQQLTEVGSPPNIWVKRCGATVVHTPDDQ